MVGSVYVCMLAARWWHDSAVMFRSYVTTQSCNRVTGSLTGSVITTGSGRVSGQSYILSLWRINFIIYDQTRCCDPYRLIHCTAVRSVRPLAPSEAYTNCIPVGPASPSVYLPRLAASRCRLQMTFSPEYIRRYNVMIGNKRAIFKASVTRRVKLIKYFHSWHLPNLMNFATQFFSLL